jgi:ABC-type nitrate/sulfonate/bicarbonate transport system ATPase subunit
MRRKAEELIAKYRVKTTSPDSPIESLSGGNVQRAVLARELSGDVDVLIVANPCFGLDFASVAEIRSQIMEQRNRGAAVLLVSEDLDEILELADRVAVMSGRPRRRWPRCSPAGSGWRSAAARRSTRRSSAPVGPTRPNATPACANAPRSSARFSPARPSPTAAG